jgi:hypothetical protein
VFAAVGVAEYRKTIPWLLRADDRVLEIGCQAVGAGVSLFLVLRLSFPPSLLHAATIL